MKIRWRYFTCRWEGAESEGGGEEEREGRRESWVWRESKEERRRRESQAWRGRRKKKMVKKEGWKKEKELIWKRGELILEGSTWAKNWYEREEKKLLPSGVVNISSEEDICWLYWVYIDPNGSFFINIPTTWTPCGYKYPFNNVVKGFYCYLLLSSWPLTILLLIITFFYYLPLQNFDCFNLP